MSLKDLFYATLQHCNTKKKNKEYQEDDDYTN